VKRPRVKRVHNPERLPGRRIRVGTAQIGVGAIIEDDRQGVTWRLLELMDGTRNRAEIADQMASVDGRVDRPRVERAIDKLIAAGFVEEGSPPPSILTPQEISRYDANRHYFAWVDTQPRVSPYVYQERLKRARVTVLGLGGTGSAVAMSLVAAGVGHVHCVDHDVVEESNLSRQLLYAEADIGRRKVDAGLDRLRGLNSHGLVTAEHRYIGSAADVRSAMATSDLLMLCADQPVDLPHWVNEAALASDTPWILGAYLGPTIVVGTFMPPDTPCYRCISDDQDRGQDSNQRLGAPMFPPGNINATTAAAANASGHFAALEALYLLAGLQPHTIGRIYHHDLINYGHTYFVESPVNPDCAACGRSRPTALP
jgi:molybdopterin/thiamine biosynthesis adenylyltransferase